MESMHKLIKHDQTASASVRDLLNNTLIGTEGTLYRLKDTAQKIDLLHHPHFFSIERNSKAIANVTLCKRIIAVNHQKELGYYIRYFAFDKVYQRNAPKSKGQSAFHSYFKDLFSTSNLNPIKPENKRSLFWAYVDPQNKRSAQMRKQFGFEQIGQFRTKAFSRAFPKNTTVERLKKEDQQKTLAEIKSFYSDHTFFADNHLFEQDQYFILKKDGVIVAGIQANPSHWEIKSLPGKTGTFMLKYANYIPIFRRLFNPKNHQFLATEGLFWTNGNAKYLPELLEGVLAINKHYSLLIWEDTNSNLLHSKKLKWGLINRMKKDNLIDIVIKSNGYSKDEIDKLKQTKKYISGFDVT